MVLVLVMVGVAAMEDDACRPLGEEEEDAEGEEEGRGVNLDVAGAADVEEDVKDGAAAPCTGTEAEEAGLVVGRATSIRAEDTGGGGEGRAIGDGCGCG